MFLLTLILVIIPTIYLQMRLQSFAANLFAYPLPPDTVEVRRTTEVGILGGNGNHCDFRAVRVLATELNPSDIEAYYQDTALPPVTSESKEARIWRDDGLINIEVDINEQPTEDGRLLVQISIFDYGYPPVGMRCH
jgi:hypothetical protein